MLKNKTSTIMEGKLLKILENCNKNLIDVDTAQLQVLDLFNVSCCETKEKAYKCECGLKTDDYLEWKKCSCN
jgi:hypothetical protein|tara:strand:+ start:535 stop:750 length:216 start_codon:yes stop_codon:yes gene_type:complete